MKKILILLILGIFLTFSSIAGAAVSTFEDLTPTTPYNGPGGGAYWNGADGSGGFISGDAWFTNQYDSTYGSWSGWAYSNTTDTTTPGYSNQYSAIAGGGAAGSSNYGVAYISSWSGNYAQLYFGINSGNYDQPVLGAYITNTTYAYLSMKNGDSFAKKFGGDDGTDPDWFKLTIYGLDSNYQRMNGNYVEFYLADYRFDDPSQDYIVDEWTWVDLSSLGEVSGLEFDLSSSDVGAYGMNTPAYFAMDNLATVPIPGALWLLGSGVSALIFVRRRSDDGGDAYEA